MRPFTASEIRKALSREEVVRFCEASAALSSRRAELDEELRRLTASDRTFGAHAQAADAVAVEALAQAVRVEAAGTEESDPFRALEMRLIARLHRLRAAEAGGEAEARRSRSARVRSEADALRSERAQVERALSELSSTAASFGAVVGSVCLFFPDAEHPGGAWVLPLERLEEGERVLEPFVLHRLAPGAELSQAMPERDVALVREVEGEQAPLLLDEPGTDTEAG